MSTAMTPADSSEMMMRSGWPPKPAMMSAHSLDLETDVAKPEVLIG